MILASAISGLFIPTTYACDETLVLARKIYAADPGPKDLFGFAMAADEAWLFVGSKFADTQTGQDSGAVYVFKTNPRTGERIPYQKLVPAVG